MIRDISGRVYTGSYPHSLLSTRKNIFRIYNLGTPRKLNYTKWNNSIFHVVDTQDRALSQKKERCRYFVYNTSYPTSKYRCTRVEISKYLISEYYSIILLKDSRDKMEKRETGYLGVQSSVSTIKYLNLTGSRELKSRS